MGGDARRLCEKDVTLCRDRVDWVAKKFLLETLQEAEGLEWTDPWLQSIDLEYHNIALDQGLYYELLREGQMRRFISEDDIRSAIFSRPRARARTSAVGRWPSSTTRCRASIGMRWCSVSTVHQGGCH